MLPYHSQPTQLRPNPEGRAAVGAITGLFLGGIIGAMITYWWKPEDSVEALADTPEEALEIADEEAKALGEKRRKWRRVAYLVNGTLATLGAGLGARMGASPHQKTYAMWGAFIGAGTLRMLVNPVFNPRVGFPALVASGLGAYLGARRAR